MKTDVVINGPKGIAFEYALRLISTRLKPNRPAMTNISQTEISQFCGASIPITKPHGIANFTSPSPRAPRLSK